MPNDAVSDLVLQLHGARFSAKTEAHVSACCDGYGQDFGRHPCVRIQILDMNSVLSCLVMYNAWMLFFSGSPTTCTETDEAQHLQLVSLAALITVSVLIR